jgi:tetratricopeptide (TPR) repeat protein
MGLVFTIWFSSLLAAAAQDGAADFAQSRNQAQSLLRQNRISAAIPFLETAFALDPSNYDNDYDLALAYLENGKTKESRGVVERALRIRDTAELHNLLGDIESAGNQIEPAARQYELAARMDPTEKNLFDLGTFLQSHNGFQQASTVFGYAAGKYPGSARLHVGLGVAYYSSGRYDEAVQALCEAVDADPADPKAIDFLGKMRDISPRFDEEVTKRLAHFTEVYPNSAEANFYYALSLRKRAQGGPQALKARSYLARAVELKPGWPEAHFELGLLYEDEREYEKATRQYEVTIKLQPDAPKPHYRLANLYRRMGRKDLADRELRAFEALKEKK